jgi:hypothetical protein
MVNARAYPDLTETSATEFSGAQRELEFEIRKVFRDEG